MASTHMPYGTGSHSNGAPLRAPQAYPHQHQSYQPQQQAAHMGYAQGYQAQPYHQAAPHAQGADGRGAGGRVANAAQITGAILSVALVVGVGVWGYKLIMRDVSGVPIVQATEGPMRVAPANPGGKLAAHQGLAVNEIAGRGAAAGPADQLVLAPTPVDLSAEDTPTEEIALARPQQAAPTAPSAAPQTTASLQALADQIAAGVAPLSDAELETPPVQTSVAPSVQDAADALVAETLPTAARSLRPQARPQALQTASLGAPAAVPTAGGAAEVAPDSLPAGTRLVQLGAYDSPEVARTEWGRFSERFGSFFDGKRRVIQQATSGGRTFYRLRAEGFTDLADARRFCAALVAERADCIPVVTR